MYGVISWIVPQLTLVRFLSSVLDSQLTKVVLIIAERAYKYLCIVVLGHRLYVLPKVFMDKRVVLSRC